MSAPACERCGSKDLRRKRPRGPWARAYRAVSGRHRYACNACHHRGWTGGVLPSGAPAPGHDRTDHQHGRTAHQHGRTDHQHGRTAHQHGRTAQQHRRPTPPPGRPLEHRDLVEERQARLDRTIGVAVALLLGALLAAFIGWALG